MAHSWGAKMYRRKYYIFESEIDTSNVGFLDLVGNRKDMLWLEDTCKFLAQQKPEIVDWDISRIIDYLRFLETKKKGAFDFEIIRAVDLSIEPKRKTPFTKANSSFTNLTPVIIVCLTKLEGIMEDFKLIREKP